MPPATPTMIRLCSVVTRRGPRLLALGVLEQVFVDFTERDRQRLLLQAGLDQWADILEDAVAQLVVVVVDLARPLGGVDHQRILARRAGCSRRNSPGGLGGSRAGADGAWHSGQSRPTSKDTNSVQADSNSLFTTRTSKSF